MSELYQGRCELLPWLRQQLWRVYGGDQAVMRQRWLAVRYSSSLGCFEMMAAMLHGRWPCGGCMVGGGEVGLVKVDGGSYEDEGGDLTMEESGLLWTVSGSWVYGEDKADDS
ncbi:hypothetical protein L1987_13539 [Smallanthus sonchifolius]|uniref:Uncharacterized protein n=1 Tax=Smallanthus sonchifolius TaxID=185202 RepID=A0ACB9JJ23_9ASTR|nr:hypothetical protein L1987_13539 [Smallanthus sonchifolius]